jgi:hypothetical protein
MIKYRQLCFCVAVFIATSSVGLAQTTPGRPAAADTPPGSNATKPAGAASTDAAEPEKSTTSKRLSATNKSISVTQLADPAATPATPASRIAIIELSPDMAESEVIRQVVEILENQGVAKQSSAGATATTGVVGISVRIAARPDTKTADVVSLIKSLQGHKVRRLSFVVPTDNRNVVTVLAPADTPWPVIDNIRIMVTAKKLFAIDVQIAPPAQPTKPLDYRGYYYRPYYNSSKSDPTAKPGTKDAPVAPRYGYSAGGTVAAQQPKSNQSSRQTVRPVQYSEIFRLQFADASVVAPGVSQLFGKDFGIVADVRTNSVLVRGDESQLKEMKALVEMVDTPQPKRLTEPSAEAGDSNANVQQTGKVRQKYSTFYVDVPSVAPSETRIQIRELDRQTSKAAESLRSSETRSSDSPEVDEKRKAELRNVVRKTFLARQELQRAELAEFAARLKRIQQSIEMRDRIADKIIDRRVEELLDPNLKWNHDGADGSQKTIVRNETVIRQQNQNGQPQLPPQQQSAVNNNQHVTVTRPSAGTVILRNAGEFRKLLTTHAQQVGLAKQRVKFCIARRDQAVDPKDIVRAKAYLEAGEKALDQVEVERDFVLKEYQTQIQQLESEVETVNLIVETAKQALARTEKAVEAKAAPSHEVDKCNRELMAALQRLERSKVLLSLYREAGNGS